MTDKQTDNQIVIQTENQADIQTGIQVGTQAQKIQKATGRRDRYRVP